MTFATDLTAAYAAQGEAVTVAGTSVTAFFDAGYFETLDSAGQQLSLRCITSTVSSTAIGDAVVRGTALYTVQGIQPIAPDELETRMILEAV